ncbi:MAG: transcription termination factor NusA [Candidatus Spechtbacterales bacterium]
MIDLKNFMSAIAQIEEEKGIPKEKIIETIEMALAAAYKKDYGERGQIVRTKLDSQSGSFKIWQEKLVVDETMIKSEEEIAAEREAGIEEQDEREEEPEEDEPKKVRFNEERHIMVDEARAIKKGIEPGEVLTFDLEFHDDFGRIAAQTAKQVIIQRVREAEREAIYEEYEDKVDQIISGTVQRIEGAYIFFDLGKTTGVMLAKDRIPIERYRPGVHMRLYLVAVEHGPKGPQIYVSRSHPKMLSRLFELEVPEIGSGAVEIKALAREAGARSKIAVTSHEDGVDPIGSCVGQRGTRVAAVIQELGGEKIDIILWSDDSEEFIANALSPARVLEAEVEEGRARVTVAEDQLSLAIGKEGQNVRLAAKLTGWKIDIVSKETGEVEQTSEEIAAENAEGVEPGEGEADEAAVSMAEGLSEEAAKEDPATEDERATTASEEAVGEFAEDPGVEIVNEENVPQEPEEEK